MKKNLKKVISAVIALAISASAFATVSFAKNFTDVASTASYAEAVDVLSALGIIDGYEDGSFQPDKTIKRSEAAKIIVAMNNKLATAEGRKGTTKFNDVAADHWASGFVNVGVSDGYINGKGEGRFDPDGEVKYQEVIKMVVSCMNYNEYANFYGGYPDGFIAIADELEITKGCEMDDEAAATRGVVAQLVYQALKTPIVKSKGMQYSAVEGGFVPGIEKQDGMESAYVKTLLTEKFDAYLVEGRVTGTYKSGSSAEMDEVMFTVDEMEKYDLDGAFTTGKEFATKVGDTIAADYLETYAEAIVQIDDANRKTLISFVPSGKNVSVELDLALLDDDEYSESDIRTKLQDAANPYVYFYASDAAAKSTKYKLEKGYKVFVNGIAIDMTKTVTETVEETVTEIIDGKEVSKKVSKEISKTVWDDAKFDKYIVKNPVGKVELIDTFKSAEGYDIVNVEYYATTNVTSVTAKKVFFTAVEGLSSLDIDEKTLEDKEIILNVFMNGEAINASEIKKDDILSIKYYPGAAKTSKIYDVYVSRDSQEGAFNALDLDEKTATVGTEDYIFVNWTKAATEFKKENLSNEYKIYLDAFGRIFTWEKSESSARYAIVDKYQEATASSTYDTDRVRLWFTDGTYKYVEFATTAKIKTPVTNDLAGVKKHINDNATKDKVMNRVVSYKISTSTGKITSLEFIDAGSMIEKEYDARNEKIGSVIVTPATTFVNVEEFLSTGKIDDIETTSIDALVDDVQYTIYRYGTPSIVDNSYPLVLIVKGEASYTEETTFAVVTKTLGSGTAEDGTVLDTLTVLYEGEEQVLYIDEEADMTKAAELVAGDVVVLKKNASDKVKEVVRIFKAADAGFSAYATLKTNGLIADFDKYIVNPVDGNPFTTIWNPTDSDLAKLVYAPIVSFKGRNYLAQVEVTTETVDGKEVTNMKTYIDKETSDKDENNGGTLDILTTDNTVVYVYDYNAGKNEMFRAGSVGDIVGTNADYAKLEGEYYTIDWNSEQAKSTTVNFAFAKIVDDIVTDIFVIIGDDE